MWNPKVIDTDHVLYVAIADAIERDIYLGVLKPNEKMPPQRSLAKVIGVNLTTISRAYKEAEKRGLISGTVGSGTYVLPINKKEFALPDILKKDEEIIELGLVGSVKIEGDAISKHLSEIAEDSMLDTLLDYGPCQGIQRHREAAARWMKQYGMKEDPDHVVLCSGAMHAISCCLLGLFAPGDRIAVDVLTFTGFKNAAKMNHMKLEPVAMDEEGMIPESLESLCERVQVKGIYLMPNMQNPTATAMSAERKNTIAAIIRKYNLILIEDDIYNFTNTQEQTALSSLVPEQGIFICSISKLLFPGLRVAFAIVPDRYLYKFTNAVTNTIWMASPLSCEIITRFIESGAARDMTMKKRRVIARRLALAKEILSGYSFQTVDSSMFLWLTLPDGWTDAEFEHIALLHKVRVIAANKFSVGNHEVPRAVRISLNSVESDEQLTKGLHILVRMLKQDPMLSVPIL
ncbi:PLP-dependent aminotransferase family protein [Ectobacillus sp. sgz5001026]|uniref:aminotransferase-like domain-containing protein n=1 Tax=Ectobacillus sp. sgz5001026 TaxID=3242473 RepID=UPI0036D2C80B